MATAAPREDRQMTFEQAEQIADELQSAGRDVEARDGYSGRGMYGDEVAALVLENTADLIAVGWVAQDLGIELDDLPRRIDSMGLGIVLY